MKKKAFRLKGNPYSDTKAGVKKVMGKKPAFGKFKNLGF